MVQLMVEAATAGVKRESEDPSEEKSGSLHKRIKKQSFLMEGLGALSSHYSLLDEPSPLGLQLRKSPSLLDLIQMKISQSYASRNGSDNHGKKHPKGSAPPAEKLKASNFQASVLKIGTWEYKSTYEGDLVAKCYYAKHKLVWEALDGGLKNKIEIQWSDIVYLKANYPDDSPGTLHVALARKPLFFRETDPQPRKHTLWKATPDFTNGQASIHRLHYLECPPGLLGKHFQKLIQCDPRLHFLSQQAEIPLDCLYFEPGISQFDDQDENNELNPHSEGSHSFFSLKEATSPSGAQSSSFKNEECSPSSCSGITTLTVQDIQNSGVDQLKSLNNWEQIRVPGLPSSMSMGNLANHLKHSISEQGTSNNPSLSTDEWEGLQILDEINRSLFSDTQYMPDLDDKSVMSRVNSLCCLLQKDAADGSIEQCKNANCLTMSLAQNSAGPSNNFTPLVSGENYNIIDNESYVSTANWQICPWKDSVGDLLLDLPRTGSLPHFLFNISDDFENKAR